MMRAYDNRMWYMYVMYVIGHCVFPRAMECHGYLKSMDCLPSSGQFGANICQHF